MIPKIIHYVWLGGEMPRRFKDYIDGWKKLMPDFIFMKWDENNFDICQCAYALEAYNHKKFGFVADYIRIFALEKYGGIYLDTDVEVMRSFDDLLDNEFFIGFENDANVGTAVIGSRAHHPLLKTALDFYLACPFVINGKLNCTPNTSYLTYFLYRDYNMRIKPEYQRLTDKDGHYVTVFGTEYFSPYNFNTKKEAITDDTHAVHRFANSWSSKSLKRTQSVVNGIRKAVGKRIFAAFSRVYIRGEFQKIRRLLCRQKSCGQPDLETVV